MAGESTIEWTDATWNPIRGCSRVSEGCRNCYAERVAARFSGPGKPYEGLAVMAYAGPRWTGKVRLVEELLDWPLRRRKPLRIFVNSMSDLFHEAVPGRWIALILGVMAQAPQHVGQVLTKRAERMQRFMAALGTDPARAADRLCGLALDEMGYDGFNEEAECRIYNSLNGNLGEGFNVGWPMRNLWLGVSVEDQATADERIPLLLQTPAAVRWFSAEPMLGPISADDFVKDRAWLNGPGPRLDWVVVGGESGPGARPMHPDWARSLRDQCQAAGVPFFFKQWGEWLPSIQRTVGAGTSFEPPLNVRTPPLMWCGDAAARFDYRKDDGLVLSSRVGKKAAGRLLDGREWNEFPEARA